MRGSLSIERKFATWSRPDAQAYLALGAVGVLAGILTAAQTPLQLPGHKALFWMIPALAGRLISRMRWGAAMVSFTAGLTTLSLGGRIAGGVFMAPMVVVVGAMFDLAALIVQRRGFGLWAAIPLFALAGTVGNLLCFVKRVFDPTEAFSGSRNWADLAWSASSYALFGCVAGLLGAAVGYYLWSFRSRK